MTTTHLLIETGRASRVAACDTPRANGEPGTEVRIDVTCPACRALFTPDDVQATARITRGSEPPVDLYYGEPVRLDDGRTVLVGEAARKYRTALANRAALADCPVSEPRYSLAADAPVIGNALADYEADLTLPSGTTLTPPEATVESHWWKRLPGWTVVPSDRPVTTVYKPEVPDVETLATLTEHAPDVLPDDGACTDPECCP